MRYREVATRAFDGIGDLVVVAPLRDGFADTFETVTFETRARMAAEALHNIRLSAREFESVAPYSDTTARILNVLDFRLGVFDKNMLGDVAGKGFGAKRYLFLTVTFDSGWEPYMRMIWHPLGSFLDVFFCNCEGYRPAGDHSFEDYIAWVRSAQVQSSIFYSASSLTVADQLWLKAADTLWRSDDPMEDRDTKIAQLTVKEPMAEAAELRNDRRMFGKSLQMGLEALNVLYKLSDFYPPWRVDPQQHPLTDADRAAGLFSHAEGRYLLRATRVLLEGLDPVLEMLRIADPERSNKIEKIYAEPLAWWRTSPTLLASAAPSRPDPALIASQVQAGIISPARTGDTAPNVGALLLLTVTNTADARAFLRQLPISFEGEVADFVLTMAVTAPGLLHLGVDREFIDAMPKEFRDGMELRAGIVGDMRENHPRNWTLPPRLPFGHAKSASDLPRMATSEIDVVIQLRLREEEGASGDAVQQAIDALGIGELCGLHLAAVERMSRGSVDIVDATSRVDHFGFRDGVSQPQPQLSAPAPAHRKGDSRDAVALGEVLLGYANDHGDTADAEVPIEAGASARPRWRELRHNSTFAVVRKIEQFPDALESWAHATAQNLNQSHGLTGQDALTPTQLKAYLVGRRQDGTALLPDVTGNDFDYGADPKGEYCPLASHIRRTNPRDVKFTRPNPRLLRRGMPFGPATDDTPSQQSRGLMFIAYVASIAEQYEVIQRWINGGNATGIASTHGDPLLGVAPAGGHGQFSFFHNQRLMRCPLPPAPHTDPLLPPPPDAPMPFTRLHWGAYLWVPARGAIATLFAGPGRYRELGEPLENSGAAIIDRLDKLPATARAMEWKRLLENFDNKDMTERYESPDVWSAIRWYHGGVMRVDRGPDKPGLVLVGRYNMAQRVLSNPDLFSSKIQTARMHDSFGLNYVTIDGGEEYWAESRATNAIMYAQTAEMGFDDAYRHAAAVLSAIKASGGGLPQVRFEIRRQFLMQVLGRLCADWFGLPGSEFMDIGGLNFDPDRNKARCPGDFISASRYIFNHEPSPTLAAIGKQHGRLIRRASLDFAQRWQGNADVPGKLAKPIFVALGDDVDLIARNLSGMMLGMLAPIEANVRGVLFDWLNEKSLWRYQAAWLAAKGGAADFGAARESIVAPMQRSICKRPAPDLLYRVAVSDTRFVVRPVGRGEASVEVKAGDIVIVSQASITQRNLEQGRDDAATVFGGQRQPDHSGCPHRHDDPCPIADQTPGKPLHACPAQKLMTGAMAGILAALLDAGEIQAMPAGLVIGVST